MTLQVVAGFLGQSGLQHPANLYRNLVGAIAGKRTGAFRYNDFALTPSASIFSLTIGPGDAVLMGNENSTTQGAYYVWNNANETLVWPGSSGQPRIDSLILRVIDTDYGSDPAGSKATWEIVQGTPAASPSAVGDAAFAPAGTYYHPGAWWRVADFLVPASSTNLAAATLTHFRRYASLGRHAVGPDNAFPGNSQKGESYTTINGAHPDGLYLYQSGDWRLSAVNRRTHTPTLSTTGSAPGLGVSPIQSGWYSIGPGPTCTYSWFLRFGTSGNNPGSGTYQISLPITAADANNGTFPALGTCIINDASSGISYTGACFVPAGNLNVVQMIIGNNAVTNASPFTWGNTDYFSGTITYPI